MSDGLARMPGYRIVDASGAQEPPVLLEMFPFLPSDYATAVPLYISMALLFIVISRAARRKAKGRIRPRRPNGETGIVAVRQETPAVGTPGLRRSDGHWGDG